MNITRLFLLLYVQWSCKSVTNCTSILHAKCGQWWFTLFRAIKVRLSQCSDHRKGHRMTWSHSDERMASARSHSFCGCLELVTFYLWGQSTYGDSLWNQYFAMFCHLDIDAFQMMQCHPIAEKNISLQEKFIIIPQVWFYNIFYLKFVTTLCNVTLDFKKAGQRLSNKLENRV